MRVVDGSDEMGWLTTDFSDELWAVGVEVAGYPSRAKVFHAIWENPTDQSSTTYDEIEKEAIAAGVAPRMVGDTNLSEMTTLTGVTGGPSSQPPGWRRLLWADLADRWDVHLDASQVAPEQAFHPRLDSGSWPVSIQPPTEGSLDWESYERLMAITGRATASDAIYVYSTVLQWYGDTGLAHPLLEATADELLDNYASSPAAGSGQNWWPADRSWLVYTDYDLSTTNVLGTEDLIAEIVSDEFLETVHIDRYV